MSWRPNGQLDWSRWRTLNKHLNTGALSRDEVIETFCEIYGLPRRTVEAKLAAYRLNAPDMMQ